jgi:hypothetical protein
MPVLEPVMAFGSVAFRHVMFWLSPERRDHCFLPLWIAMKKMDRNNEEPMPPLATFFQLVGGGRQPVRADRTAGGTLPMRAARCCEPVSAASAFGWYVFLPMRLQLLWDGHEVFWRVEGMNEFQPLRCVGYPGLEERFDLAAPEAVRGAAPPFLTASIQEGSVQVWPGSMVATRAGWSVLVRPVANLARPSGYELREGIVETDEWFGPLFTNIRLTRTGIPIELDDDIPFMQVQPVEKGSYQALLLDDFKVVDGPSALNRDDWDRYARTVVEPNGSVERRRGGYAAGVRKAAAQRRRAAI